MKINFNLTFVNICTMCTLFAFTLRPQSIRAAWSHSLTLPFYWCGSAEWLPLCLLFSYFSLWLTLFLVSCRGRANTNHRPPPAQPAVLRPRSWCLCVCLCVSVCVSVCPSEQSFVGGDRPPTLTLLLLLLDPRSWSPSRRSCSSLGLAPVPRPTLCPSFPSSLREPTWTRPRCPSPPPLISRRLAELWRCRRRAFEPVVPVGRAESGLLCLSPRLTPFASRPSQFSSSTR